MDNGYIPVCIDYRSFILPLNHRFI